MIISLIYHVSNNKSSFRSIKVIKAKNSHQLHIIHIRDIFSRRIHYRDDILRKNNCTLK